MCSVAREQTPRQTDTKVNTEDTLSGFQEFFLQPIIKDRSNTLTWKEYMEKNCEETLFITVCGSATQLG